MSADWLTELGSSHYFLQAIYNFIGSQHIRAFPDLPTRTILCHPLMSSPPPDSLANRAERSNRRPSALESQILRASIDEDLIDLARAQETKSSRQQILAAADQELAEATARLESARAARVYALSNLENTESAIHSLEVALANKRFILHPIRTISIEVLLEIFKILLRQPRQLQSDSTITVLSSVSQRWRNIIAGYAPFWTKIDIDHSRFADNIQIIDHHYDQLQHAPLLSISIRLWKPTREAIGYFAALFRDRPIEEIAVGDIWAAGGPEIGWPVVLSPSKMVLDRPRASAQTIFPQILRAPLGTVTDLQVSPNMLLDCPSTLPLLESLTVAGYGDEGTPIFLALVSILYSSPNLKKLAATSLKYKNGISDIVGPLEIGIPLHEFSGRANLIAKLADLKFQLPQLRRLHLTSFPSRPAPWKAFVESAPNVEYLSIKTRHAPIAADALIWLQPLRKLTTLEFNGPREYRQLSAKDSHDENKFHIISFFEAISKVFKTSLTTEVPFPLLSTLIIRSTLITGESLIGLLKSNLERARRWREMEDGEEKANFCVVPITRLELWECPNITDEDRQGIDDLLRAGIRLSAAFGTVDAV